jgi:hypothetical protein
LAGNVSGPSNVLSMTIDGTPPPVPSQPDLNVSTDSGSLSNDNLTNFNGSTGKQPLFTGLSEPNATVQLYSNVTGPTCASGLPSILGTAQANASGNWSVTVGAILTDGVHAISARVRDLAGNLGSCGTPLNVTIDTTPPATPPVLDLTDATDSGRFNNDSVTSVNRPQFTGTGAAPGTLTLRANGTVLGTAQITTGNWSITAPSMTDGTYVVTATLMDAAGNESVPNTLSPNLVIDTVPPGPPAQPDLDPTSDSGSSNSDNITNDSTPTFTSLPGDAEPDSSVAVFDNGTVSLGTAIADGTGRWTFTVSTPLTSGSHLISTRATDLAGNVSGFSLPLGLTIDTVATKPVIQTVADDTGHSSSDRNTSDTTLTITGTAEPGSEVTLREGLTVLGTATADAAGAWSVLAVQLSEGVHLLTAQALDLANNLSVASDVVAVTVDLTAPSIGGAVTVLDTGVQGDAITSNRRAPLSGVATRNHFVDILNEFGAVVGSGKSALNADTYSVQFTNDLADGTYTVRVRASDDAGNSALSEPFTFTVDGTPPQIISVTPNSTQTTSTSQIVVQFNNDNLNNRAVGDPAFGGSVTNPANFALIGSGFDGNFTNGNERIVSLTNSVFAYDNVTDRLTITVRDASGNLAPLTNDTYRFVVDGTVSGLDTQSVQDIAGNSIDGNRDNVAGGDFTQSFVIAVPAVVIDSIRLSGTSRVITDLFLFFSEPLEPATATNLSNYRLEDAGRDKNFATTADNVVIGLLTPVYDAAQQRVALRFNRGISHNKQFQLTVRGTIPPGGGPNDAIRDASGNLLDGDFNGAPGGNNVSYVLRGKKGSYRDSNGDQVNVQVAKSGLMELIRFANGEGRTLHLTGTSNRSILKGTVAGGGDGLTHFVSVTGTENVNLTQFTNPPFVVENPIGSAVAADVVDRLLDSGESVSDVLVDGLMNGKHRKEKK